MRQAYETAWSSALMYFNCVADRNSLDGNEDGSAAGRTSPSSTGVASAGGKHHFPIRPVCLSIDDISFLRPVEVGSHITFESFVTFSKGSAAQVNVKTRIYDFFSLEKHKSNEFSFTFLAVNNFKRREVIQVEKQVMPITYEEAMMHLAGKRAYERSLKRLEGGSPYYKMLEEA